MGRKYLWLGDTATDVGPAAGIYSVKTWNPTLLRDVERPCAD
jgi:hypothetical protein